MLQLLDLCLRLDATEVGASADIQEAAETAMLKLLLDVRVMGVWWKLYITIYLLIFIDSLEDGIRTECYLISSPIYAIYHPN